MCRTQPHVKPNSGSKRCSPKSTRLRSRATPSREGRGRGQGEDARQTQPGVPQGLGREAPAVFWTNSDLPRPHSPPRRAGRQLHAPTDATILEACNQPRRTPELPADKGPLTMFSRMTRKSTRRLTRKLGAREKQPLFPLYQAVEHCAQRSLAKRAKRGLCRHFAQRPARVRGAAKGGKRTGAPKSAWSRGSASKHREGRRAERPMPRLRNLRAR
mmetsp:Transcript_61634/g.139509  ORF Transcript_61634/g.139509 Transcript_61634/m.139509 type:complete len:215 (+) Transcript_61634:113-757(+)